MLHTIDCRTGQVVADFRVCVGSVGLVKTMCIMSDGNAINVGHSAGLISQLDTRTGKLRQTWKGHEGEVLTLTSLNNSEFMSTSLDQTVSIWSNPEGKFKCSLPGTQESGPIHCVSTSGDEIIMGSTANRIVIHRATSWSNGGRCSSPTSPEGSSFYHTTNKLKADIVKSNLTAMKVLPMNKLLLLGQENGTIRLIC